MTTNHGGMKHQVLKTATQVKLRELNAHEQRLRTHYAALLKAVGGVDTPTRDQLETLYAGVKDLRVVQTQLHPGLDGVGTLADFAKSDMWTTAQAVELRRQQLLKEIDQRQSLWRHNKLLGALLHESLTEEATPADAEWEAVGETSSSGVGELTADETLARLEEYFFAPAAGVTEQAVYNYLESTVFAERAEYGREKWIRVRDGLSQVRAALETLSESFLRHTKVASLDVMSAAERLLRDAATMADDVADFLRDVQGNPAMQQELADVLTIELGNLTEFTWPAEGVPVQFKRGISGRFRCHLQEDAVSLLLFEHVGQYWGSMMRMHLSGLLRTLEPTTTPARNSVELTRKELRDVFTLAALDTNSGSYEEENNGQPTRGFGCATKLDLLRMLSTETHYRNAFSPDGEALSLTAVTTDLAFFGPSIAHAAVLGSLRFFGIDAPMRAIFSRYMQLPLLFPGAASPRVMQRGLSVGRAMTMFFSEVILFVMDFSVRSTTDIHLFRRHDDIIFFDADPAKAAAAWRAMESWAAVAGLAFNAEKSGSVVLSSGLTGAQAAAAPLPPTPIRWGLLELQSDATVRILDDKVDAFAAELADRLAAAPSVFRWINAYNKYMVFFVRNFGSVAPVFGPAHADAVTRTLHRVHRRLFPDGDVLAALRARIAVRHEELLGEALPAAWAQWPLALGGLGLHNPFLTVWTLRRGLFKHLEFHHTRVHEPWPKDGTEWPWRPAFSTEAAALRERFRVFEETVLRDGLETAFEHTSAQDLRQFTTVFGPECKFDPKWRVRALAEVLDRAAAVPMPHLNMEYAACIKQVCAPEAVSTAAYNQIEAVGMAGTYWQWLALLYSDQFDAEFGTVDFFSRELVPSQLIDAIQKSAVSW
ncbi:hypothetical protein ACHHYP_12478 [Achlya hypogyna]|uniref:Reverse transcriptase domain-containing protein n=1 Tax=Achlya hypogyna TaxID=1202772 RepID=A0A1V9YGX2_ACHHY|nr:hypothetical protein ACHHYP_12478 [Achlya hypogyna]